MIARRSSGRALSTASIWPWLTMTCCWRPTRASESSSWTSSRRHGTPLMAYSLSPLRNSVRAIVTSENSIGRIAAELSIVRLTSARPSAGRVAVPAKMTSSIFWLRTADGACAPSTQAIASTTFDLPDPFGPTTTVTPGSSSSVVASANDLNPLRVSDLRNTAGPKLPFGRDRLLDARGDPSPTAESLTHRAVVGRAAAVGDPADEPAAARRAAFAGPSVDPVGVLIRPALPHHVDVAQVGQCRAARADRLVEDRAHRRVEGYDVAAMQRPRRRIGMQAG